MKAVAGRWPLDRAVVLGLAIALFDAIPLPLPAQESSPDAADTPIGTLFRWLNFLLVLGAIAYAVVKFGAPYFRSRAQAIGKAIAGANQTRAAAERELREASEKLAGVEREIEQERHTAERESEADRERIRALARSEVEKINQAGRGGVAGPGPARAPAPPADSAEPATHPAPVLSQRH